MKNTARKSGRRSKRNVKRLSSRLQKKTHKSSTSPVGDSAASASAMDPKSLEDVSSIDNSISKTQLFRISKGQSDNTLSNLDTTEADDGLDNTGESVEIDSNDMSLDDIKYGHNNSNVNTMVTSTPRKIDTKMDLQLRPHSDFSDADYSKVVDDSLNNNEPLDVSDSYNETAAVIVVSEEAGIRTKLDEHMPDTMAPGPVIPGMENIDSAVELNMQSLDAVNDILGTTTAIDVPNKQSPPQPVPRKRASKEISNDLSILNVSDLSPGDNFFSINLSSTLESTECNADAVYTIITDNDNQGAEDNDIIIEDNIVNINSDDQSSVFYDKNVSLNDQHRSEQNEMNEEKELSISTENNIEAHDDPNYNPNSKTAVDESDSGSTSADTSEVFTFKSSPKYNRKNKKIVATTAKPKPPLQINAGLKLDLSALLEQVADKTSMSDAVDEVNEVTKEVNQPKSNSIGAIIDNVEVKVSSDSDVRNAESIDDGSVDYHITTQSGSEDETDKGDRVDTLSADSGLCCMDNSAIDLEDNAVNTKGGETKSKSKIEKATSDPVPTWRMGMTYDTSRFRESQLTNGEGNRNLHRRNPSDSDYKVSGVTSEIRSSVSPPVTIATSKIRDTMTQVQMHHTQRINSEIVQENHSENTSADVSATGSVVEIDTQSSRISNSEDEFQNNNDDKQTMNNTTERKDNASSCSVVNSSKPILPPRQRGSSSAISNTESTSVATEDNQNIMVLNTHNVEKRLNDGENISYVDDVVNSVDVNISKTSIPGKLLDNRTNGNDNIQMPDLLESVKDALCKYKI